MDLDTTGDTPTNFITRFHNLKGDLIGERKRNFFKLIKDPALFSTEQQLDEAVKMLQPRTYLENLFKVDLLIYFKRTAELTAILKEGNEVFISKIIKQAWYFQEAFNDLDAQSFTNIILPFMSYAMRMKLLKRLSTCWNEEKTDALFDALYERYGLHIAVAILQTCSKAKIEEVLNNYEINLRPNQVRSLIDRDPLLSKIYIEYFNRMEKRKYKESEVLHYMAVKCPILLLELEKDDKVATFNIGRRASRKIVELVKEDVPRDIHRYTKLLKKSVIVRRLGNEFNDIYFHLFPKRIDSINMYNSCNDLLTYYSKNRRWKLFAKTFSEVFPNNYINEALSKFDEEFLKLNPSRKIIQKWAKIKYTEDKNRENTYLRYFEPSKAIPLIEAKINVSYDIYDRHTTVMLLIHTCGQNKDLEALEGVLKYISTRHRQENSDFRTLLYETITSSFELDTLNENHWKYINKQTQISINRVKNRYPEMWCFNVDKLVVRHLEFLFKNHKDHNFAITDYINICMRKIYNIFVLELQNPPIEKQIYIVICKQFPIVCTDDEYSDELWGWLALIICVIDFSISQLDHFINLADFPNILTLIYTYVNKTKGFSTPDLYIIDKVLDYNTYHKNLVPIENYTLIQLITHYTKETKSLYPTFDKMITKRDRSDFENELVELYFEKLFDNIFPRRRTVHWFMRNEPRTLIPYFEKVIDYCFINSRVFKGQQLRLYSHFNYDSKACEIYKAKLRSEDCEKKELVMKNLILLLPTADFTKVVDYLQPKKHKLDLEDEEMTKIYKLQCDLARILPKVQEPSIILPLVMKFCVGDYLQSALPSLYGVFYKSAEKLLYPYADELSKREAISVKKHALFLSCEVLSKKSVLNLLKNKHSDVSSQKHQYSATLKYFLKNPCQEVFAHVVENMLAINKYDTETLEKLKDIKVPSNYRPSYIEKCWEFFEDLEKSDVKVKDYLENILQSIDIDILKKLSSEFVMDIISRYLPLEVHECLKGMEEFTIKVLEHREMERSNNFEIVFKILLKKRKIKVQFFFNVFIKNPKYINRAFVNIFEQYWKTYFTMIDTFQEHIALKLLNIHLGCTGNPERYAENIVACLEQLVSEFGLHVFSIFKDRLLVFMNHQDDTDKYLIFHNILKHTLTPDTCLLVLQIMQSVDENSCESFQSFEVFQTIMRLLRTVQDEMVRAHYKTYLIDNDLEEIYSFNSTMRSRKKKKKKTYPLAEEQVSFGEAISPHVQLRKLNIVIIIFLLILMVGIVDDVLS